MSDLLDSPYEKIYAGLSEVREVFHREGRISDSNAKLDETVKLLSVHFAARLGLITDAKYEKLLDKGTFSVKNLNAVFKEIAIREPFTTEEKISIFGANPTTAFDAEDENVAYELMLASGHALSAQSTSKQSLDVLNEAFGHHVRDNFRSHIEDAQYMTPPEVIDFMVELAATEIFENNPQINSKTFVMMDPSCGVGSFISSWRKEHDRRRAKNPGIPTLVAIGQDKVERMARLSAINLIFSGNKTDRISVGNSLLDGSPIDRFNNGVDLILTNPPFGAKFPASMIKTKGYVSTPFFAKSPLVQRTIDSELLFIDRYLTLLKPGGYCLAVVPDGVISAKGIAAVVRQHLARSARVVAIVEMPAVTFAQAGTRTKTAVLVFQKHAGTNQKSTAVFFGEATSLGFEVTKRKGVPVKWAEGTNQLPTLLDIYRASPQAPHAVDTAAIGAWRDIDLTRVEAWTPRQFVFDSSQISGRIGGNKTVSRPLSDLVESPIRRKPQPYKHGTSFISILHVIGEGLLDVTSVRAYKPITPGSPISPGEVIISRLNPRIPRVLVVPDIGGPLLCSTEFEVLRPKKGVSPYELAYLLMSPVVQQQIQSLTAGTSASHSRVKSDLLYEIQMPWPKDDARQEFNETIREYENSCRALIASMAKLSDLRSAEAQS